MAHRQFKVGDKIRVNLHHGKIEDAVVKAVVQHTDEGPSTAKKRPQISGAFCHSNIDLHRVEGEASD